MYYGILSEVDYPNKVARVFIESLGIVTDWATLPGALKSNRIFADKQQVAVIKTDEDWEILGEIPTDGSVPTWINDHTEGHEFSDGAKVTYNVLTHELTFSDVENVVINCNVKINGNIEATGNVKGLDCLAGTKSLSGHTHGAGLLISATPGAPVTGTTGTPL